jgi:hypothetical protein
MLGAVLAVLVAFVMVTLAWRRARRPGLAR